MKKIQKIVACITYIIVNIHLLLRIDSNIYNIISAFIVTFGGTIIWLYYYSKLDVQFIPEFKKILKEILLFVPVLIVKCLIDTFLIDGTPVNQQENISELLNSPILYSIIIVIIGPIYEEGFNRFLPYTFMKNKKWLYIIVTSLIFAGGHVMTSSNPLYYLPVYLPTAFWYAYRYSYTEDIMVPTSLHVFNNLIAIIFIFIS